MEETPAVEEQLGGESACYAHLLCLECGAVLSEEHLESCRMRGDGVNSPVNT